jgi:ribosomal peptide maturation radical SAM protein 1
MQPLELPLELSAKPESLPSRVALINMPFAMADRPSIQCGLLKAALTRAGHEVTVHYLNVELAAEFGAPLYSEIARLRSDMLLGDWLFAAAAFGYQPNETAYREACSNSVDGFCKQAGTSFERLCELRRQTLPEWILGWLEKVDWSLYSIIGFTSTFEQNAAAFSLARAIKERHPEVTIVFGGANFDGDMGKELVRALPFIDYAVIGEGDKVFPEMVDLLARGESPLGLPGVAGRRDGVLVSGGPAQSVKDLDSLGDPIYDEYFATVFRLGRERVLGLSQPKLLFESSRGCWWGEKQHCTFCGLNNNGMSFRSKSAEEVSDQLRRLASQYNIVNFEAVDNIMNYRYLEQLCKPLSEERFDYHIFYEVKANLSPAQLRTMARAGITAIQPGIESLSSHILSLMRKGISMLRNVRLLKWAYYYKMRVSWNLLTGFPGETEEDYAQQFQVVRLLRHLPPPFGCGPIWLERFSPYFFDPTFPVRDVKPLRFYSFIYPEGEIDLEKIAYFFEYRMDNIVPLENHQELQAMVGRWITDWKKGPRPSLVYHRAPDWIQILDQREKQPAAFAFHGAEAEIYEFCGETDRTVEAICEHLAQHNGGATADEVNGALQKFCDLGLMLEEGSRYLSLALPVNSNW